MPESSRNKPVHGRFRHWLKNLANQVKRKSLFVAPLRRCVRLSFPFARSQAPALIVIHKSLREPQNPEGVQAHAGGWAKRHPRTANRIKFRPRRGRSLSGADLGYHQSEPSICSVFGRAPRFMGRLLRPLRGRGYFFRIIRGCRFAQPLGFWLATLRVAIDRHFLPGRTCV